MSRESAREEAIRLALIKLESVDLKERCKILGLASPEKGAIPLRIFGKNRILRLEDFALLPGDRDEPVHPTDRILALHYLCCDLPLVPGENLISFRELPGGLFYFAPFQSRSIKPLISRIGNDLDLLRKNMNRFDWEQIEYKDFSARIHALGKIHVTLVYRTGDEEFSPSAEVLFDSMIKRVFTAEDISVLASRICLGLI